MRVVYFTGGSVGAGHAVRGVAIARALQRAGFRGTFTRLGPESAERFEPVDAAKGRARTPPLDADELRDPGRAPRSALARALDELNPDLLVADLFWAPLLHLLPRAGCAAWLLVRKAPLHWLVGPPKMRFPGAHFDRLIGIEPGITAAHPLEAIDPVVVANRDEVQPRNALRDALGVGLDERLVIAAQAGQDGECDAVATALGEPATRLRFDGDAARFFPLATWLPGADRVGCGAGYNAYWEARTLGYAGKTLFVPFARAIDDQAWRLEACASFTPRHNGADVLARWILSG